MERISNNTTNLDGLGVKSNMLIYIYKPKGKIVTVRTKKKAHNSFFAYSVPKYKLSINLFLKCQ